MALKIRITGTIGESTRAAKAENGVYFANSSIELQSILTANPDEKDVYLEIDSDGGSVFDGLAMYDLLRTSGRSIHANIVGGCHSIATVILLAAPKQRRTSNPNSRSLIHLPRTGVGDMLTGAEFAQLAEATLREEQRLIEIYVERTNLDETKARAVIEAEKIHTAQEMLKMGFISKINSYTTNHVNFKKMAKSTKPGASLLDRIGAFFVNAANVLSPMNFNYEDAEGNLLFATASEEDNLAVGDEVAFADDSTGGTFTLPDGRVVVIEDFIVTSIETEAAPEEDVEALRAENAALREQLTEAVALMDEMRAQISSNYTPKNRTTKQVSTATRTQRAKTAAALSKGDVKEAIKSNYAQAYAARSIKATPTAGVKK